MLKCPACGRVYEDNSQTFCLNDGVALVNESPVLEPTLQYGKQMNQPRYAAAPPPAKKPNYLLILGGVAALMLVLFIGVILLVGVIVNLNKNNNPINTANVNVSQTPVTLTSSPEDKYQPELKMAINSANNAQSTAYASQDASLLRNYYSGEALKAFTTDVENLKKSKIYQISTMQKQDYEYFKINDAGTEAEVRVVETWETNVFQTKTRKCLLYYPPTRTPQTIYLKKSSGGWIIESTVYDAGIKKEPQQCPKKN